MNDGKELDPLEILRHERDLYRRLLRIDAGADPQGLLEAALRVAVEVAHAMRGLVAVYSDAWVPGDAALWQAGGEGGGFSTTLLEATLQTGRPRHVASLAGDPDFSASLSVQYGNLQSAICVPLKGVFGVLYLQDRVGGGAFTGEHLLRVLDLVEVLGPALRRGLLRGAVPDPKDPTAPWRYGGRFADLVGRSAAFARALEGAVRLADMHDPAVVCGPEGAGKSVLAAAIHRASARGRGPMVVVACAALEGPSAVAELLGTPDGPGLVGRARGGTLLLDGIEDLDAGALMAVLPLLAPSLPGTVPEVRILATMTGACPDAPAHLRRAMGHRFASTCIHVPPLADRGDDLALLADHFGETATVTGWASWAGLTPAALEALRTHPWRHNLVELRTVVERLVEGADGKPIEVEQVRRVLGGARPQRTIGVDRYGQVLAWDDAKFLMHREYLRQVYELHDHNVTSAARAIGIRRSHLSQKLGEYGLRRASTLDDADG